MLSCFRSLTHTHEHKTEDFYSRGQKNKNKKTNTQHERLDFLATDQEHHERYYFPLRGLFGLVRAGPVCRSINRAIIENTHVKAIKMI